MTPTLDDRLAAGAAGLRHTVGTVEPGRPPRPPSTTPRILAALVLAVALAGGAVAVWGADGEESDVAMSSGELPALLSADPPAGLGLSMAYDQELVGDADPPFDVLASDVVVYGDAGADDPFAERDLEVLTRTVPPGGEMTGDEDGTTSSGPVTVRGQTGLRGLYGDTSTESGLRFVQWKESDTLMVRVASYSLTDDELTAVADALVVEDGVARLAEAPDGVPGPLDEVGRRHRADYAPEGGLREHTAYYLPGGGESTGEPGTPSAMTTVLPGGAAELAALRWELGPGEAVEVDGREGWLATDRLAADPAGGDDAAVVMSLVWPRSDGVLVRIDTAHLGREEVVALAESLEVVSPDEWAGLVARNGLVAVDEDPADEGPLVGGPLVEAPPVEGVTLDEDERVPPPDADVQQTGLVANQPFGVWREADVTCAVWLADRESLTCVGAPGLAEVPWATLSGEDGASLAFGVLPEGTVDVQVNPPNGTPVVGRGTSGTGVWAVDTSDGVSATVSFLGPDGSQVGSPLVVAPSPVAGTGD